MIAARRRRAASADNLKGGIHESDTKAAGFLCTIAAVTLFSIESSAADSAKEISALRAVDQDWVRAYNAGNADAVANLYDEQAVLLPPGAPAVNGRAAIKAFFVKDTAESQKVGVTFSLGPKPAGGVSMKKGGKWLYVRDTWNADGAPTPESAAPAKK